MIHFDNEIAPDENPHQKAENYLIKINMRKKGIFLFGKYFDTIQNI
jgi:hypothetical protein